MLLRLRAFVTLHEDCFERELTVGHITGSAWVLDRERTHALLHHHHKLGRWMQLGGHADGDPDVLGVAMREAMEESGLRDVKPISGEIFDVDIHEIPARDAEPRHFHYDVRYLLEADRLQPLRISSESKELRWARLDEIPGLTEEESVLRMARKSSHWPR